MAITTVGTYFEYKSNIDNYEKWQRQGFGSLCESISQADAPESTRKILVIYGSFDYLNSQLPPARILLLTPQNVDVESDLFRLKITCDKSSQAYLPSDCLVAKWNLERYFACKNKPVSYFTLLGENFSTAFSGLSFLGWVLLVLATLLAPFAAHLVIETQRKEKNLGVKRLQLASSGVVGAGVAFLTIALNDGQLSEKIAAGLAVGVLCFSGVYLASLVSLALFMWVREGFRTHSKGMAEYDPRSTTIQKLKDLDLLLQTNSEKASDVKSPQPNLTHVLHVAGFWDRLWAKSLDIVIIQIFGFVFDIAYVVNPFISWEANPMSMYMGLLLIELIWYCFLFYLYESYFIYKFGFTLGKWLFGIKVTASDGQLLSLKNSKTRACSSLGSGLYYFIYFPIFQTYSLWKHYREFKKDGTVSWDTKAGSQVQQIDISSMRRLLTTVFSITLLATNITVMAVYKTVAKEQVRQMTHEQHTLSNIGAGRPAQ